MRRRSVLSVPETGAASVVIDDDDDRSTPSRAHAVNRLLTVRPGHLVNFAKHACLIDKILNKKTFKKKIYYLIRWFSVTNVHITWEPLANLNCWELIEEYEKLQMYLVVYKNKKSKGTSSVRVNPMNDIDIASSLLKNTNISNSTLVRKKAPNFINTSAVINTSNGTILLAGTSDSDCIFTLVEMGASNDITSSMEPSTSNDNTGSMEMSALNDITTSMEPSVSNDDTGSMEMSALNDITTSMEPSASNDITPSMEVSTSHYIILSGETNNSSLEISISNGITPSARPNILNGITPSTETSTSMETSVLNDITPSARTSISNGINQSAEPSVSNSINQSSEPKVSNGVNPSLNTSEVHEPHIEDETVNSPNIAEYIVGMQTINGVVNYLIQWQGKHDADFFTAKETKDKWPELIIQYLEEQTFSELE